MSQQFTAKINKSFYDKIELLEQTAEDMLKDRLISMAQDAVTLSPVDRDWETAGTLLTHITDVT